MADDPVTLITGGAAGIGAATAERLLRRSHRVAVTGRDPERLARFAAGADAGQRLAVIPADAAEPAAVERAVRTTVERFGRLDTVIANAGMATFDAVDDGNPQGWREMILVNVLGPALLVRAALPSLRRTRGRIILVGSLAGLVATHGNLYGATKWAVTGLAENVRLMVAGDGIRVTLIAPGRVDTSFWARAGGTPPGGSLTAGQVADNIVWVLGQPEGVDLASIVIRPMPAAD
ncbi:SDR family oxidoreductase [Micromonospora sp. RB23]